MRRWMQEQVWRQQVRRSSRLARVGESVGKEERKSDEGEGSENEDVIAAGLAVLGAGKERLVGAGCRVLVLADQADAVMEEDKRAEVDGVWVWAACCCSGKSSSSLLTTMLKHREPVRDKDTLDRSDSPSIKLATSERKDDDRLGQCSRRSSMRSRCLSLTCSSLADSDHGEMGNEDHGSRNRPRGNGLSVIASASVSSELLPADEGKKPLSRDSGLSVHSLPWAVLGQWLDVGESSSSS